MIDQLDELIYSHFLNRYNSDTEFRKWFDRKFTKIHYSDKIDGSVADKVLNLMVNAGQHDPKFKLGETIRYSPSEVHDILWDYIVAEDT